jgi:hypothetical protein
MQHSPSFRARPLHPTLRHRWRLCGIYTRLYHIRHLRRLRLRGNQRRSNLRLCGVAG